MKIKIIHTVLITLFSFQPIFSQAVEETGIAQLARSTGTFLLSAGGSKQYATEFAELGQAYLPTPFTKH